MSVQEVLLIPSVLYSPHVRRVLDSHPGSVHAAAHVTGGGIAANLARALPAGLGADLDRHVLETPRIFAELQALGGIRDDEMARTFNLGVGMVLVVDRMRADDVVGVVRAAGLDAAVAGEVTTSGAVVVR